MPKRIKILLTPRASRNEIIGTLPDGTLKVKVTAPPVDGKANEALLDFLSQEWDTPISSLSILRGEHGKLKIVQIEE